MAKIKYTFADGHTEEIEVDEKVAQYLLEEAKAKERHYWKEYRQKERGKIQTKHNLSLSKMLDDGIEVADNKQYFEETFMDDEEKREKHNKILSCLTKKQREVYILHKKGLTQRQISKLLGLSLGAVNERLSNAKKNILKIFFKNPNI